MTGSCFLVTQEGWACSNDVFMDVEKDLVRTPEGVMVSKQTNTLKINGIFNGLGTAKLDMPVECLFMVDETDAIHGFNGRITAQGGDLTVVTILTKNDHIKEILTKIK